MVSFGNSVANSCISPNCVGHVVVVVQTNARYAPGDVLKYATAIIMPFVVVHHIGF